MDDQQGYLYVMRCREDEMNRIKVGFSKDPDKRLKQLHTTGTVWPMDLYRQWSVNNMRQAERVAHDILEPRRCNDDREFFAIAPREHYNLEERMNDEISDALLNEICFCIEDAMGQAGVSYHPSITYGDWNGFTG